MRPNEPRGSSAGHGQPKAGTGTRAPLSGRPAWPQACTLAELGQRCGYSASQISRYERGIQPLTDITLLRRFAGALAIPPQILGLTPVNGIAVTATRRRRPKSALPAAHGPNVSAEFQSEGGDDPVRRRELLARAAGLAGAAALGLPAIRPGAAAGRSGRAGLDDLLYGSAGAEPVPLHRTPRRHHPGPCLISRLPATNG